MSIYIRRQSNRWKFYPVIYSSNVLRRFSYILLYSVRMHDSVLSIDFGEWRPFDSSEATKWTARASHVEWKIVDNIQCPENMRWHANSTRCAVIFIWPVWVWHQAHGCWMGGDGKGDGWRALAFSGISAASMDSSELTQMKLMCGCEGVGKERCDFILARPKAIIDY